MFDQLKKWMSSLRGQESPDAPPQKQAPPQSPPKALSTPPPPPPRAPAPPTPRPPTILAPLNWRESDAHLLLLSKFLESRTFQGLSPNAESWKHPLKEPAENAFARFVQDEMVRVGDTAESMAWKFKVTDLKRFLKERGLPVSGRKAELIERLVQADPAGMGALVTDAKAYVCTSLGQELAQAYLDKRVRRRAEAEQAVLNALKKKQYKKAVKAMSTFEAEEVFARGISFSFDGDGNEGGGIGTNWKRYDSTRDVALLEKMFEKELPPQFRSLPEEVQQKLRLVTGAFILWGANPAKKLFKPDELHPLPYEPFWAVNVLHSHAHFQLSMDEYKKGGVKKVKVYNVNDDCVCAACWELANKTHLLDEMPDLPYEKCTCAFGCRCSMVAVTRYEEMQALKGKA